MMNESGDQGRVNMGVKRRRRGRISNLRGMACIAVVVGVLLVSLTLQSRVLKAKNEEYSVQAENLNKQIKDEEARTKEIEDLEDYMKSDEYVEEIARDKLGLAYEDEILFKPE